MNVAIYEFGDSSVAVLYIHPMLIDRHDGDEDAAVDAERLRKKPAGVVASEVADIPTAFLNDRKFRNAWVRPSFGQISVDMPKARVIHMDRIRNHRAREFLKLDDVRRDAEDAGDATALDAAKAKRILFKNIPQTSDESFAISAAATPANLDAIWPTALLGARPAGI